MCCKNKHIRLVHSTPTYRNLLGMEKFTLYGSSLGFMGVSKNVACLTVLHIIYQRFNIENSTIIIRYTPDTFYAEKRNKGKLHPLLGEGAM